VQRIYDTGGDTENKEEEDERSRGAEEHGSGGAGTLSSSPVVQLFCYYF
jgi:hypothetical protein